MSEDIDEIILKSILGEDLDDNEVSILNNWLGDSKKNEEIFSRIKGYWNKKKFGEYDITNDAWDKMEKYMQGFSRDIRVENNKKSHGRHYLFLVAASLIILLGFYLNGNWLYNKVGNRSNIVQETKVIRKNDKGEKRTIKLPDGSIVKLNAESSISFPEYFSNNKRELTLKGEAFFDIKKDTKRPFHIYTGEVLTTVKGTSFNVKAFDNEGAITVSVLTGEVEVKHQLTGEKVKLLPNDMGRYDENLDRLEKGSAHSSHFMWKDKILYFKDASFAEVIKSLERWYGVSFIIKEKRLFKKKNFSGEFENQTLGSVLESISYSGKFTYKIEGKSVIIK